MDKNPDRELGYRDISNFAEMVGKTVSFVHLNAEEDAMLVGFSDNTLARISANGYNAGIDLESAGVCLFDADVLVRKGVLDQRKWDAYCEEFERMKARGNGEADEQ